MECYDRREESISRSCEGSDIVFENLLGDLQTSTDGKATRQSTIESPLEDTDDRLKDIFDDDLFEVSKDEMERHSICLLTDFDDEEEESESVEGLPDLTTSPFKAPQISAFDSILLDLDEKTKEMEKLELTRKLSTETADSPRKQKRKRRHRRKRRRKQSTLDRARSTEDDAHRHLICCQTEGDLKMLLRDGQQLNPWKLRQWEFDQNHQRRSLRTLLSTLNRDVLWEDIVDAAGWEPVRRKDIVYLKECYAMFHRALSVFHCDKSKERGDSIEQQIICEWVYQALQKAYCVMKAKQTAT